MPNHNFGSEQQWLVTVQVGTLAAQTFDTFSGGDVSAPAVKHRPGGMGPEKTYSSLPTYTDVTVSRVYETQRDHTLIGLFNDAVGRQTASITTTPLDENGVPWGEPRVYQGRIIGCKTGKTDSNSNAPRVYELDFSIETVGEPNGESLTYGPYSQ